MTETEVAECAKKCVEQIKQEYLLLNRQAVTVAIALILMICGGTLAGAWGVAKAVVNSTAADTATKRINELKNQAESDAGLVAKSRENAEKSEVVRFHTPYRFRAFAGGDKYFLDVADGKHDNGQKVVLGKNPLEPTGLLQQQWTIEAEK